MRVVQIGLGGWGKNHTRVLYEMGVLAGICDVDRDKVREFSSKYDVLRYYDIDSMIKLCNFDAAIITTPTITHYDIAKKLIKAGKHVFVEKPFTYTTPQGKELVLLADKYQVKITCGYIERFNPVTQYIQGLFKGAPLLLEFHRESQIPAHIKDVGIVLDTAVHDIDTACFMFGGYPKNIYSSLSTIQGKKEDMSIIVLEFENGKAVIVSNWNTKHKLRTIHATYPDMTIRGDFVKREVRLLKEHVTEIPDIPKSEPLEKELKSFLSCIEKNTEPQVTANHAVMITDIAQCVLNSRGIPIHV